MQLLPIKRALISLTDKTGITELGSFLAESGVEIVSTGGTRKKLLESGLNVVSVSDVTGFPEIMGGRVKTLHPSIHAGILADKDNPDHLQTLTQMNIQTFDLICVNLYDFAQAMQENIADRQLVEEIDIGGPTLLRAGAKNYHSVAVLPHPQFYSRCKEEMQGNQNSLTLSFRKELAAYTFDMVSKYDAMIAKALA